MSKTTFNKLSDAKMMIAIGSLFSLVGCAPIISGTMNSSVTEAEVKAKTAEYFGVAASKLDITNFSKNTLDTTYKTKVNGKLYNCSLYYGSVDCKVPGG